MQLDSFFSDNLLSILFCTGLILYGFASVRNVLQEKDQDNPENITPTASNRLVYHGNKLGLADDEIAYILTTYNAYYAAINPTLQDRFRERLRKFMHGKTFVIHAKEGYKEMPVLTSAAAIQISFGLDRFLLPWFGFIQIYLDEFIDVDTLKVIDGEVDGKAVSISWSKFLKGISDPGDGENVGIHEMAHALYYQNVVIEKKDLLFKNHFDDVLEQGKKIFDGRDVRPAIFNNYAFKNLQEFWAESVEMFFEKPEAMHIAFPDLFMALKLLLRQDPPNKSNPLHETAFLPDNKLF